MYFPVTNLSRGVPDAIIGNSGSNAATTLETIRELERLYGTRMNHAVGEWNSYNNFEKKKQFPDSYGVLDVTFFQSFPEAIKIFLCSCPDMNVVQDWRRNVENICEMDGEMRKRQLKDLLKTTPDGVFFYSRLHIDTTYNLGDAYVTVILGETMNFVWVL